MKVSWTHTASVHLVSIYEFIARDSPIYGRRVVDRLTRRSQQIGAFPFSGRKVPEHGRDDLREVIEGPYRIIYRIKTDAIDVVAVIHGAQVLPPIAE